MKTAILTVLLSIVLSVTAAAQSAKSINNELKHLTISHPQEECDTNDGCCHLFPASCQQGSSRVYQLLKEVNGINQKELAFDLCVDNIITKWNGKSESAKLSSSIWLKCEAELPPAIACTTDSDCEAKNPIRASAENYLNDRIEGAQR